MTLAKRGLVLRLALLAVVGACPLTALGGSAHPWIDHARSADTLTQRIAPPPGFVRVPAAPGSFGEWLRGLPLKPEGAPVQLYNGQPKGRQDVHVGVLDVDVGTRDLQQCADAIMRLRAEWQLATGRTNEIAFNYTDGGRVSFARWAKGERPSADGKRWSQRAAPDASYASFRRYLTDVFTFAGSYSLSRELRAVPLPELQIGDVFIKGGFPGHAVLIADLIENPRTGERRFLLVQSYMPAQDIHVLKNPRDPAGSPWYPAAFSGELVTPEWPFPAGSLKRWP